MLKKCCVTICDCAKEDFINAELFTIHPLS